MSPVEAYWCLMMEPFGVDCTDVVAGMKLMRK
jgi:hypothetical protein